MMAAYNATIGWLRFWVVGMDVFTRYFFTQRKLRRQRSQRNNYSQCIYSLYRSILCALCEKSNFETRDDAISFSCNGQVRAVAYAQSSLAHPTCAF